MPRLTPNDVAHAASTDHRIRARAAKQPGESVSGSDDAEYSMYLGIALKQSGQLAEAARALQNAINMDASLQRASLELSALYAKQGKAGDASAVLKNYLKWNPQSIVVRLALEGLR